MAGTPEFASYCQFNHDDLDLLVSEAHKLRNHTYSTKPFHHRQFLSGSAHSYFNSITFPPSFISLLISNNSQKWSALNVVMDVKRYRLEPLVLWPY